MRARVETWCRAGISGVLAVLAGLAVGELAAAVLPHTISPFQAVALFLVDHSPASAREWAITTFGTSDKMALMVGLAAVVGLIAVGAGIAQASRPPLGSIVVGAFALCGVGAALRRPASTLGYAVPSVIAGVVAVAVLVLLCRRSRVAGEPRDAIALSRRTFLIATGAVAVTSAVAVVAARQLARAAGVLAERAKLVLPQPQSSAPAIPPGTQVDVEGVTPFVTGNASFYRIDTALQVPQLSTDDWRLRIHGMVEQEVTLDWRDLTSMPAVERLITLTCVSNEVGGDLAGNARWLGFPMRDILAMARPHADADMLLSTSIDGWTSGTPLDAITDGRDALLAIGMNGTPLPVEHGYPVRQVVPGLYGFVSACKWVIDWEITRFDRARSYWAQRGWGVRAPIKTASRIDRPAPLSSSAAGPVVVAGSAWAQHRGVRTVEVRVDDGPWQQATLATEYSIDTWRQWSWTWPATPGLHTLYCRATDADGNTQPEQRVAPIPDGATGWHSRALRIE